MEAIRSEKIGGKNKYAFARADNPVASNPGPAPPRRADKSIAALKAKQRRSVLVSLEPSRKNRRDRNAVEASGRPYHTNGDRRRMLERSPFLAAWFDRKKWDFSQGYAMELIFG